MKSSFRFNDRTYISPSKKMAREFVRHYEGDKPDIRRLKTTWRIKHVELAPNWAQLQPINLRDKIEYGKKDPEN